MQQLMERPGAEMLAIIGRRRVGKTYLVKQVYGKQMVFDFTGTQYASRKNQLGKFAGKITDYSKSALPVQAPATWAAAVNDVVRYRNDMRRRGFIFICFLFFAVETQCLASLN